MRISLLGPVEVWADDGSPVDLGGGRSRTLLIRLAVDPGRTVGHDALIDAVWGDEPPANASNALQQLVSRLRRRGVPISATSTGYRIELVASDIDIFGAEAAAPWRGPVLADVADHDFAQPHIARLTELRVAAAEDAARGVADLEALTSAHPLRERPVELLMRELWSQGRPAEALAAYDSYRSRIADRLGSDPSAGLSRLHVEILQGEEPRERRLPAALTSFVGRDAEVRAIQDLLGHSRLVTLVGPGGSGKTRLALESARAQRDAWLVELAPLSDGDEVAPAVLAALGMREHLLLKQLGSVADPVQRVVGALRRQQSLLILDNCEHLLDAVARTAEAILTGCPEMRIVATSREPLGITGESLWQLEPLADDAALDLFTDRARSSQPSFRLSDPDTARQLCRALDGMPLAIELAAARLRTLPLDQLANRIDERFRLLTGGSRTALPRHQTLRAVVDWSWDLCTDAEREVWTTLSVFHGGAPLAAMQEMVGDNAFEMLSALVDKSLAQVDGDRYTVLETIREYGLARLGADAADQDLPRRAAVAADPPRRSSKSANKERAHARFFLDLAEAAEPHLRTAAQLKWLTQLRSEHDNLHAALRRAIAAGDALTAVRLVAALGWYWWLSGYRAEGSALADEALALPPPPELTADRRAIAYALTGLNTIDGRGDSDRAQACFQTAADLVGAGDTPTHPILKLVAPICGLTAWDVTAAQQLLPAYADLFDDIDPWAAATARAFHGHMLLNLGLSSEQARADFEQALATFRALGDRWGMSLALEALCMIQAQRGDFAASADSAEEAITMLTQLGTAEDLFQLRLRLAQAQYLLGEQDEAMATLKEADRLAQQISSPFGRGAIEFVHGNLARVNGDFDEAQRRFDHSLELIGESIVAPQFRAVLMGAYGMLEGARGDLARARRWHIDAIELALSSSDSPVIGVALVGCADLSLREGDPQLAATLLGAAEAMNGSVDHSIVDRPRIESATRVALGPDRYSNLYRAGLAATTDTVRALTRLPAPS